ncbi:lantibiotic dehydratase [uncultured Pedobacter sp.]|uniref:lantibiotic dehydratase n=1 Tax=uncultured Pedobacter sp. TaxID=246139 RepID=UPI0025D61E57|nr:lantibiotic dehydratase [uncultured Pedobacter sp.]
MNTEKTQSNSRLLLYPYVFFRYASGDHSQFEQLKLKSWISISSHFTSLNTEIKVVKELLCDYLFHEVSRTDVVLEKQLLINLKRDVFNDRDVPNIGEILAIKSNIETNLLHRYSSLRETRKAAMASWKEYFDKHQLNNHKALRKISSDELFLKGIRLSSNDLYNEVIQFVNKPIEKLTKKDFKIEYSLLRYLTRMYYKTSPFSTFTHIGLGKIFPSGVLLQLPAECKILSRLRLNNRVLEHIKNLVSAHPDINDSVFINFNPTIDLKDNKVSFLINFHNLESFQTVDVNPVINRLLEIRDTENKDYRLNELVGILGNDIDATPTEIKEYLLKLVEVGLLEFDFKVSPLLPDWDTALIEALKNYESPSYLISDVIKYLKDQRLNYLLYETSAASPRHMILQHMVDRSEKIFDDFLECLGLKGFDRQAYKKQFQQNFENNKFKRLPYLLSSITTENIVLEDTYTPEIAIVDEISIKAIVELISELGNYLKPFSKVSKLQQICEFFIETYGLEKEISLLDFYRDYAINEKNQQESKQKIQPGFGEIDQIQKSKYNDFFAVLKEKLQNIVNSQKDEICLTRHCFEEFTNDESQPAQNISFGMFTQLYVDRKKLKAVINSVCPGMGRASGRFLHLFDEEVTAQQRELNKTLNDGVMMMELSDASFFNANIHPPLLPYELKIPNGYTALPIEQQIDAKRIMVYICKATGQLCLRDKISGKQIIPYDMCLQSVSQRSKLYQLLSNFSVQGSINFNPIRQAVQDLLYGSEDKFEEREVYFMPRLVYEDLLILKRKSWTIRTRSIPKKKDQQDDAAYFMELNEWRTLHHIPAEIFLYIKLRADDTTIGNSDDYKPQYICFETPLIVALWSKLLRKAGDHIFLEEMLPSTDHLNKNPINETLIQWYEYK